MPESKNPVTRTTEGVLPHNIDAEVAVLGALLIDADVLDTVVASVVAEDFYRLAHTVIFQSMLELYNAGTEIDLITLSDIIESKGQLDKVGGATYLASLASQVPSSANVEFYVRIVRNDSQRRQLIASSRKNMAQAYDLGQELPNILEDAERRIFEIAENRNNVEFISIQNLVKTAIEVVEDRSKRKGYSGIPSGFPELDNLLSGFQDSEFIVLGARPSVGKTALAMSMAANISMHDNIPVGIFSLEMSEMALVQRLLSSESGVSGQNIRSGALSSIAYQDIVDAASRIYDAPLWIAGASGRVTLLDLRAQARRMCSNCAVKIIFIDYISLISSDNPELQRHEQIAEISRSLKSLARELKIPIVALSQLTRESEGKRPVLANIRESGSIEQDADVVLFLHRERKDGMHAHADEHGVYSERDETDLIVAKQRNGPVGTVKIDFISRLAKFVEHEVVNV